MAQGEFKKRSDKFAAKVKSKSSKKSKPLGPRKGGHYIAPKKAARAKNEKIKKHLTKQICQQIEKEVHQRAASAGNEFRILGSGGEGTSSSTQQSPTPTSKGGKKKSTKQD